MAAIRSLGKHRVFSLFAVDEMAFRAEGDIYRHMNDRALLRELLVSVGFVESANA